MKDKKLIQQFKDLLRAGTSLTEAKYLLGIYSSKYRSKLADETSRIIEEISEQHRISKHMGHETRH